MHAVSALCAGGLDEAALELVRPSRPAPALTFQASFLPVSASREAKLSYANTLADAEHFQEARVRLR